VVKKPILALALFLSLFFINACEKKNAQNVLKAGYTGGYLFAALYAAQKDFDKQTDVRKFQSSSDVAYSLLSGALDVGFVDADKLSAFSQLSGFERLTVVGKITYPYGATLILRKGLNSRLQELDGLIIAASKPNCVLLKEFIDDTERLKASTSGVQYKYMAFDAMVPALEAKAVDAIIVKGTYSITALQEGHSILYQNWEVEPGDECCPAVIDQAALVLLARRERLEAAKPFIEALLSAQKLLPEQLRRAVADNTVIPFEILQGQPVPQFSMSDDNLVKIFVEAENEHNEDNLYRRLN
jgi:ABC-type nitrate/sulfonate/bicarbonate transport system substrate-binding protein